MRRFRSWVNRHRFEPAGEGMTPASDELLARLRPHVLRVPVELAIWIGLPILFACRARRTRRLREEG